MKNWPLDHPKAKAMARRRGDILDAARSCFIKTGYAGTSMDAIADAAGISLMTLYRHAESKDDLFAATVSDACRARDDQERQYFESLLDLPFRELLTTSALHIQDKITRADTVALMRLVIAEATAFPHLLPLAYDGFVTHFENLARQIIQAKSDARSETIALVARAYVDCLVGADTLRILMGQPRPNAVDHRRKAEMAADIVVRALGQSGV